MLLSISYATECICKYSIGVQGSVSKDKVKNLFSRSAVFDVPGVLNEEHL